MKSSNFLCLYSQGIFIILSGRQCIGPGLPNGGVSIISGMLAVSCYSRIDDALIESNGALHMLLMYYSTFICLPFNWATVNIVTFLFGL